MSFVYRTIIGMRSSSLANVLSVSPNRSLKREKEEYYSREVVRFVRVKGEREEEEEGEKERGREM